MNKKKAPEETKEFQIKKEELEALSARVAERKIEEDDWQRLHRYLVLLLKLTQVLEYGRVRTRKLMRILFGKRTEKDKAEEGKSGKDNKKPPPDAATAAGSPDGAGGSGDKTEPAGLDSEQEKDSKAKGHGRHPASAYGNAQEIVCPVCGNKAGDRCPECGRGRLRNTQQEIVIRVKGSAPVTADRYKVEKLRCDTCGLVRYRDFVRREFAVYRKTHAEYCRTETRWTVHPFWARRSV